MRFEAVRELQKDEQAHELRVLEKKLGFERQIAQSGGRAQGWWVTSHLARVEYFWAGPLRPWDVYELRFSGDVLFAGRGWQGLDINVLLAP